MVDELALLRRSVEDMRKEQGRLEANLQAEFQLRGQRRLAGGGQFAGQCLHFGDLNRGESAWPAGPAPVIQAGQPLGAEPSPPLADGVNMHADLGGDRGVGLAGGGGQDDLSADHIAVSGPGRLRPYRAIRS